MQTFAFVTFGCRLNQAESAQWQRHLEACGMCAESPDKAALVCVHSCAVTASAEHEVLRILRKLRLQNPFAKIVLSGCAATLIPDGLADIIVPHSEKQRWFESIQALVLAPAVTQPKTSASKTRTRASLIVQDGCDRYCAYCIVPYMRGRPISESLPQLLTQAQRLIAEEYREIVLTGCHLALYRDPETGAGLLELLERLCDLTGDVRFRLGSVEPGTVDDKALIRLIAQSGGRLCDFLHFPIQTASNKLLSAMGRPYTQAYIRELLDFLFSELPLCGVGADWIVGLPGETDDDAEETIRLLRDYPFIGAHIFPYSQRPGTRAATFPNQVPQHLRQMRVDRLHQVAEEVRVNALKRYLGQTLTVIPEHHHTGWSSQYVRCLLPDTSQRGVPYTFIPKTIQEGKLI